MSTHLSHVLVLPWRERTTLTRQTVSATDVELNRADSHPHSTLHTHSQHSTGENASVVSLASLTRPGPSDVEVTQVCYSVRVTITFVLDVSQIYNACQPVWVIFTGDLFCIDTVTSHARVRVCCAVLPCLALPTCCAPATYYSCSFRVV